MEKFQSELISNIDKLDKLVIWIRTTIELEKRDSIFMPYNEIKTQFQWWNTNIPLCINRIDILIQELHIINIEKNIMEEFYAFRLFLHQELSTKWIKEVSTEVQEIIYL
jgi:hypothetical protein